MKLKDQVAIITGSSRNIGQGIALRLAREGCKIVVHGVEEDCVESTRQMIADLGVPVIGVTCDIADAHQAQALIDRTVDAFGRVDILVNNAGIVAFIRSFLELSPDAWQRIIGVNLGGLFNVSVPTARVMAKQGSGCIVNISSVGATRAHRNMVPYDATKGGIEAATRAMALDLAPHGIRVNAIALGNVRTDRWDGVSEAEIARRRKVIPLGREETADDAAAAVVFLCSDEASYITGQTLAVDGGLLAQARPPDAESAPPSQEKQILGFGNSNG